MKKTISVHVSEEKLSAVEMYLEQKNTTLSAELDKQFEQIYAKVVPQNVRDFIDMKSRQQKSRPRRTAESVPKPEQ